MYIVAEILTCQAGNICVMQITFQQILPIALAIAISHF